MSEPAHIGIRIHYTRDVPLTPYRKITDYKPQSLQRIQRETKKKLVKSDRVEFDRAFGSGSDLNPRIV